MIKNQNDEFRKAFFDKLIADEKEKTAQTIREQANCSHKYDILSRVTSNGYQSRTCSKCGHSAIKSIKVWNGTRNGSCVCS